MNSKGILTIVFTLFVLVSGVVYVTWTPEEEGIQYEFERKDSVSLEETDDIRDAADEAPGSKANEETGGEGDAGGFVEQGGSGVLDTEIVVYIHGAVANEGVYTLESGARVHEALEMAGGMLKEASTRQVNLARFLVDGESIYFPTKEEEVLIKEEQIAEDDPRININTATADQLEELPGIGEAKARSILAYRTLNGRFKEIEEIMNVSGIKESLFESLKDMIRID